VTGLTNRWAVLGLVFLIGVALPMQFQSVPALAPFLIANAGLNYTDIGVLTGLFLFPGILLAAPGGLLAARIGDKAALMLGLSVMLGAALMFASTESYAVMFASRLLGGAGAVLITILLPKVVTDWFVGKEIATALATVASSFGLGVGLAMALLPAFADVTSWPIAIVANSGVTVLAMVILFVFFQPHNTDETTASNLPALWVLNRAEFVLSMLAGIGRTLFSTGYVVFMSFTPPLLMAQGLNVAEAGLLTSLAALVSMASVPLGGVFSDKTGKPNHFIVIGAVGTALACVLVPYIAPALLWILLFGLLRGGCTGGIMALPSQVLRPESRNAGFAVASAVYFIGMAAFPAIAGYVLDATANTAAPLWFAGLLWISIPVLLAAFKFLQHKWRLQP
jgi:cyanate permease